MATRGNTFRAIAIATAVAVGVVALPPVAASAAEDQLVPTYRITGGTMTYEFDATASFIYQGECFEYVGGWCRSSDVFHQSSALTLDVLEQSVATPAANSNPAELVAETAIESFVHDESQIVKYASNPCDAGSITNTTVTDSFTYDDTAPSYMSTNLFATPGVPFPQVGISLGQPAGTEPRFGWRSVTGLYYNASDRYGTAQLTTTQSRNTNGCSSTAPYTYPSNVIQPFDFPFAEPITNTPAAQTYTLNDCPTTRLCHVTVAGSETWSYPAVVDNTAYSGGGSVEWTFDIEVGVEGVQCNDVEVDVAGDVAALEWFKFVVQATACEPGIVPLNSVQMYGDITLPPATLAIMSSLFTVQYDPDAINSGVRLNETGDVVATGSFDLCVDALAFLPGEKLAGGAGKLIRWASKHGGSSIFGKTAKFMIKQFNVQVARVAEELGRHDLFGDAAATKIVTDSLSTAFSDLLAHGLSEATDLKVCVPMWEIAVTFYPEADGSGVYYSLSDEGIPVPRVTHEFKAQLASSTAARLGPGGAIDVAPAVDEQPQTCVAAQVPALDSASFTVPVSRANAGSGIVESAEFDFAWSGVANEDLVVGLGAPDDTSSALLVGASGVDGDVTLVDGGADPTVASAIALAGDIDPIEPLGTFAGAQSDGTWSLYLLNLSDSPVTITSCSLRIVEADPQELDVRRLAGLNRFETGVAISLDGFEPGVPVVYVATGTNFPDALSAGPAAAAQGGALLLVTRDSIPGVVAAELTRLQPDLIVVVGGASAISDATFDQLSAFAPEIRRDAGADRYATSIIVNERAFPDGADNVWIATGVDFPDALSASAAAAHGAAPVLLVYGQAATIPADTELLLEDFEAKNIFIAGGTPAVSGALQTEFASVAGVEQVQRLSGANRYATSVAINSFAFATPGTGVPGAVKPVDLFLATGTGFADALAGGALAGHYDAPLFVTQPHCLMPGVITEISRLNVPRVTLLGGPPALSSAVESLIAC